MAKKRVILVLLISLVGSLVFGTGMPVIDISAITQAITSALQEAQRWEQQIRQWQSEYDKAKKAIEGISSGDFTAVVSGIASLSGQLASINEEFGWIENARFNEFNSSLSDGSYSLLDLASNTQLLINNYDKIVEAFQENLEKAINTTDSYDSVTGLLDATGTLQFDQVYNLLRNGGAMVVNGAEMVNSVSDMFNLNPEQVIEIYESQMESSMEKVEVSSYDELNRKIDEETQKYTKLLEETSSLTSEQPTAKAQAETRLQQQKETLEKLQQVKEMYEKYQEVLAKIESKIPEWEATQNQTIEDQQKATTEIQKVKAELESAEAKYKQAISASYAVSEWYSMYDTIDEAIEGQTVYVNYLQKESDSYKGK